MEGTVQQLQYFLNIYNKIFKTILPQKSNGG